MEPDVVVIGAGHNGLVAAGYLARAGLSVTVLEAAPSIGGMTVSDAVVPEAPDHLLNLCAVDVIVLRATTIVQDLELSRYGYREIDLDPMFAYLHPDGESVVAWRDVGRTVEEFSRLSAADGRAYRDFARMMDAGLAAAVPLMTAQPTWPGFGALGQSGRAGLRGIRDMPGFLRMLLGSGENAIDRRFTNPVIRGLLTGMGTFTCSIEAQRTGIYLFLLGLAHRFGVGRPVGGMGALARALAAHLEAHGGTIRCGARVSELTMSGDRVSGVRLADGSTVSGRLGVLAACDPGTTLLELLPRDRLPVRLAARMDRAPRSIDGVALFKMDLALSGEVRPDRFLRSDGVDLRVPSTFVGTEEEITTAYRQAAAGQLPDVLPFYAVLPTAVDPSQAPAGQDTMYLYTGASPLRPMTPWSELRESAAKSLVDRASQFYDGITELEIGRHIESNEDLYARTGSHTMTQIDLTLFNQGPLRPAFGAGGYRGPVPGLWLSGTGTHPGGTVAGISGKLAAAKLLDDVAP